MLKFLYSSVFSFYFFLMCLAPLFPFPSEVSLFRFYPSSPFLVHSPSQCKPSPLAPSSLSCCFSEQSWVGSRPSPSGSCAILSPFSREEEEKVPWVSSLLLTSTPVSFSQTRQGFLGTRSEQQSCTFWLIFCFTLPETSHGYSRSIPHVRISVTDI